MTDVSVEDLDRELAAQAAVSQRVLADAQRQVEALTVETDGLRASLEDRTAELAAVRAELGRARAELQWLRRAGVDLLAIMEHPVTRALRAGGRRARALVRRAPREA